MVDFPIESEAGPFTSVSNTRQYLPYVFDLKWMHALEKHCSRLKSPFQVQLEENAFTLTW